jgi:hypothetical protein
MECGSPAAAFAQSSRISSRSAGAFLSGSIQQLHVLLTYEILTEPSRFFEHRILTMSLWLDAARRQLKEVRYGMQSKG